MAICRINRAVDQHYLCCSLGALEILESLLEMATWTEKLYGERLGCGNCDVLNATQLERQALKSH